MKAKQIGQREFVDGATRIVFEDAQGQCVLDDDGQRVYGVWLLPDEPTPINDTALDQVR
jgi:hypothetical protein